MNRDSENVVNLALSPNGHSTTDENVNRFEFIQLFYFVEKNLYISLYCWLVRCRSAIEAKPHADGLQIAEVQCYMFFQTVVLTKDRSRKAAVDTQMLP